MTQWTLISFTKKGQNGKGKENDRGKAKTKGKSKGKGKQNEKGKSSGKGKSNQEKFQGTCRNCGRTQVERMLGERRWSCETSEQLSVRRRKLVT